jgi:hypothetical protein
MMSAQLLDREEREILRLMRERNTYRDIAAELLDALRLMVSHYPHWTATRETQIDRDAIALARAAIRKAEAEE